MSVHVHDFAHRMVTEALIGQKRRLVGCCACGLSQPMAKRLESEVRDFLGHEPADGDQTRGDA